MDIHTADRDELIERYRSYAHALAAAFIARIPPQVDKDDVLRYAELGLVEAATTFNAAAGVHFKTYSYYRIRGAIYDGLRVLGGIPRDFYRRMKFERAATAYLEDYSAQPASGRPADQYEELKHLSGSVLSAYLLSLDSVGLEPHAKESETPDYCYQTIELAERVRAALTRLPQKNRMVIEDYYFNDRGLEEIAKRLGLSKSWVCRLHARSIQMLRPLLEHASSAQSLDATAASISR